MSANCPSSAIANWPISASIVRTFRALPPELNELISVQPPDERITPASLRALSFLAGFRRVFFTRIGIHFA